MYSLDASVTIGGIFKHDIKKSRQICFNPTAAPFQPLNPLIHRREISFRCSNIDRDSTHITTTYQIAIELGGGGQLILGRRVPINVHVTEIGTTGQNIILNDYQVMLIQKTVTRVGTQSKVHHLFRTLRTVSNLNVETSVAEKPRKTTVTLADNLWGAMNLPTDITPTFETCNISRSYKLEVRLGFRGGPKKVGISVSASTNLSAITNVF